MNEPATIRLEHVYAHAPSVVWRALTDPEIHAKWFAAGDIRPVVGHLFDLDMGGFGKQPCEVVAVEPERHLKYRFATGTLDTTIAWTLFPEGEGTRLVLEHHGFDLGSPLGHRAYHGMKSGWPAILLRLAAIAP